MNSKIAIPMALVSLLSACAAHDPASAGESDDADASSLEAHIARARTIASFDPMQGQLPEGLAVRGADSYVSFAPLAEVDRVDVHGNVTKYATLPTTFGGSKGFTLGLAFGKKGELYVGQASFDPASVTPGVFMVPKGGGAPAAPWATHADMAFPNGIAVGDGGTVWVADSGGAVFRVDPLGNPTEWSHDPLLAGDPGTCGYPLPFAIGANGIVVTPTDVWVTNTDRGALVRIPVLPNGDAGAAEAVLDDCAYAGADGLVRAKDGSLVFAINAKNQIVRWSEAGGVSTVYAGTPLDFPASLLLRDDRLVVTNAAFIDSASPSLVSIELR